MLNNNKPVLFTDRTRIESHQRCARARWLGYEYPSNWAEQLSTTGEISLEGTYGLQPLKPSLDMSIGSGVHKGLEYLLWRTGVGVSSTFPIAPEIINISVREGIAEFHKIWDPYITTYSFGELFYELEEALALVEALIRCYALAPSGLQALLQEYEIVEVEKELSWTLLDTSSLRIQFNSRPDGILKHRSTGQYFALSFKTAKEMNEWQSKGGQYDNQGISELLSAGKAYPDKNLIAVLMIYLLKGRKGQDEARGSWIYNSPLIHPYAPLGMTDNVDMYRPSYYWTDPDTGKKRALSRDYKKIDAFSSEGQLTEWITYLAEADPATLDSQLYTPTPFYRDPSAISSWWTQTCAREHVNASHREAVINTLRDHGDNKEILVQALDNYWLQDRVSCVSPFTCSYIKLCHEGGLEELLAGTATPEELGYMQRRENHPERLIQIEPKGELTNA